MSEKIQLEQKLKLQRVELHKQANQMQGAEDKTRAELFDLQVRWRAAGKRGLGRAQAHCAQGHRGRTDKKLLNLQLKNSSAGAICYGAKQAKQRRSVQGRARTELLDEQWRARPGRKVELVDSGQTKAAP